VARTIENPTITRAWVNNGQDHHVILFATWQHEHGWFDRKTGEHGIFPPDTYGLHPTSCYVEGTSELLAELEPFEDDGRWPTAGGES
jgi:hypothetical protein